MLRNLLCRVCIRVRPLLNEVLSLNAQECLVIVKAGRQTQSSMKS